MKRLLFYLLGCLYACAATAQGIPFLRNYMADEYHAHDINFDVNVGKKGLVYIANFEGLLYYDNEKWHTLHTPNNTRITVTYCDKDSSIWVGGYTFFGKVVHKSNGEPLVKRVGEPNLFKGEVVEIWEKDGLLHFLVNDGKVFQVEGEKVSTSKVISNKSLNVGLTDIVNTDNLDDQSDVEVLSDVTQEEPLGNGWKAVVKKGEGLSIVNEQGRELYHITENNGLSTNNISWLSYNGRGVLWGATENGVISLGVPSVFTHFADKEGLKGDVLSIIEFGNTKYVGTVNGLYRQEGMSFVNVGGISHACWALAIIDTGLLAGTSNGVYHVAANGSATQLTTFSTTTLFRDGSCFYSGEIDGVFLTQTATMTRKRVCNLDKVTKIIKDTKGTIWLQSIYGEIWYKTTRDKAFKPYKKNSDDNIATLVMTERQTYYVQGEDTQPFGYPLFSFTDQSGVTWLTNHEGKSLYRWKDGKRLTDLDQLLYPISKYSIHAILVDGDEIWLGTDQGLVIINTAIKDPALQTMPKLMIRQITVGTDSVLWGGFGEQPSTLATLSSKNRNLRFNYALDYEPLVGENVYRHKLNDGEWSAWADDHDAEYLNLPYGKYTFMVQARDAFGRVTEVTNITFAIDSPFYLKWYMILVYIILLGLVVVTIIQWRLRKLEEDKQRLEKIVDERTEEVRRTHKELVKQEKMATVGKLTQGLIDRILNPLNYINNFSKLSEGLVKDVEANIEDEKDHMTPDNYDDTIDVLGMLSGNLQKVSEHGQNTTRTLKAMEEMLKDRSGGMVKTDLVSVLHQNREMVDTYYQKEIQEYKINVTFDIPDTPLYVNANPELLSKTIMSLMSNSIYYVARKAKQMSFGPMVNLRVTSDGEIIVMRFYDNGLGIEDTIIDKIFDPFFTTKTTGEASGIGLYLSHDVIQNYGGDITVHSVKNEFTEFIVTLPAFKE